MTDKEVVRGDDYWNARPIFVATITDNALSPYNLTGCTVRATWDEAVKPPESDPDDSTAVLRSLITIDGTGGVVESVNCELPDGGSAAGGILFIVADRATTAAMPLVSLISGDVQITHPDGMVETRFVLARLSTRDGYTSEAP